MRSTISRRQVLIGMGAGIGVAALGTRLGGVAQAQISIRIGSVYTLTNAPSGNAVAVFNQSIDGSLTPAGTAPTGGAGSGGGLGNQGAVVVSKDGRWLLAVNAGSDSVSVFRVQGGNLTLTDTEPSGGGRPISVTIHGDRVYVLNDAPPANISGFRLSPSGMLTPIADSTRPLSTSDPDPAQVEFSPNGRVLVVTEKATDKISTYVVDADGRANGPFVQPSNGATPFGFAFHPVLQRLLVSEAFGGMPNASAVSSYALDGDGRLRLLDGSVPTRQTAACWVVNTPTGLYAYATNTGSGTITGYRVDPAFGGLTRLNEDGITAGQPGRAPLDAAIDRAGRFLYVLTSGTDRINGYAIGGDGGLTSLPGPMVVPDGATGMAAF